MIWDRITSNLDIYFDDIPDPTDEELQQIEDEWVAALDDDDVEIPEGILELLWQEALRGD